MTRIEQPSPTATRRTLSPAELFQYAQSLQAQGRLEEAGMVYRRLMELAPNDAEAHNNLGRFALSCRRADEALASFEAALALAPSQPETHYNRAQALLTLGRRDEAMAGWRATLALAPNLAPAHFALARVLQEADELQDALYHLRRAVVAAPAHAAAQASLARLLAFLDEKDEANEVFARALVLAPQDAMLHSDAGAAQAATGEAEAAIELFNRAIALQPDLAAAHNNLGNALAGLERWDEAARAFHQALALEPDFAEAHGNLGQALLELKRMEEALARFEAALTRNPAFAQYHNGRGRALMHLGDLAASAAAHEMAVQLAPDEPDYYSGLALTRKLAADDPAFLKLQQFAETMETRPASSQIALHFALHRSLEHQGKHEAAFAHLAQGNALRRPLFPYEEKTAMHFFRRIEDVFSPAVLARAPAPPVAPDVPIFILGMPRSGSTLVEQILASHRDVFGAGELMYMTDIAASLVPSGLPYPENMLARTPAELTAAGDRYRARLRALAPNAARITDKMPVNFIHTGLLRHILPGARIIHTRRNPVDTCLSCFAQTFGAGLSFSNDLAELGRYYRAYDRLTAHWHAHLPPGTVLEVEYEALVADFEPQVRRILEYCGLDWDPACLAFHEHQRPVLTASATQVRQKLYSHAAGRSRHYGKLLAPLLAALEG